MKIFKGIAFLCFVTLFSMIGVAQNNYNLHIEQVTSSAYDTINFDDTLVYSFKVQNSNTCITSGIAYNHTLNFSVEIQSWNGNAPSVSYYVDSLMINPYRNNPLFLPIDSFSDVIDLKIPIKNLQLSGETRLGLNLIQDSGINLNIYQCSDSGQSLSFFVNNPNCYANFDINTIGNAGTYIGYNYSTGTNLRYHWYFGDGDTSNQQFPIHTYTSPGYRVVQLTVYGNNGCSDSFGWWINFTGKKDDAGLIQLQILAPTGINDVKDETRFFVFPNPVANELKVNLGSLTAEEISIYNIEGRLLIDVKRPLNNGCDVSSLSAGLYVAEVKVDKVVQRIKWVKL